MNTANSKNLLQFILFFLKPYKYSFIIFVFLAIITGLWAPVNNLLLKYIIDALNSAQPKNIMAIILWPAIYLVVNFEIHNLCWRGMGYINYKCQPFIKNEIISYTLGYVHQHSQQFFQANLAGRIANQINILAENIERIVHEISRHIIRTVVLLIATFAGMYYVNPRFFYGLFVWVIMFSTVSLYFSKHIIYLSDSHAGSETLVTGQLVDSITNSSSVRIFAK